MKKTNITDNILRILFSILLVLVSGITIGYFVLAGMTIFMGSIRMFVLYFLSSISIMSFTVLLMIYFFDIYREKDNIK